MSGLRWHPLYRRDWSSLVREYGWPAMMMKAASSPLIRMCLLVISVSFLVELGERLLPQGHVDRTLAEGVVGSSLLSLTLIPVLYLLAYRPWQKQMARQSEERYRALAETSPDVVFVVDREGNVEYANELAAKVMGLPQEQIVGCQHQSLFPRDQAARHWMNLQKVIESGEPLQVEDWTQVGKRMLWYHTSLVPLHDARGGVRAVLGVARDLTERKLAEQALAESEARFRAIFERTTVGIIVLDLQGRLVEANPAIQRMLGYSRDELVGLAFGEVTHPDDARVQQPLHEELVGGKRDHYQLDKRYVRKDGTIRRGHLMVSTVDYGGGRFILGLVEDVTERKRALEDLALVQAEWKGLFETVHPTMVLDVQHTILAVNHATSALLGLREWELVGKKCYEIFHGATVPTAQCPVERALQSKQAESGEVAMERCNRTFLVWTDPVLSRTGEVDRFIQLATDVTERVQAEEELRDYQERMRAVFESIRLQRRVDETLLGDL